MIFRKLQGIPSPHEYSQTVPFSMMYPNYIAHQGTDLVTDQFIPVPDALEAGNLKYTLNSDRTFEVTPWFDSSTPTEYRQFTFEGFHEGVYIIDIDHYEEKVFGYNHNVNKFFRVKMYLLEHDARFTLDKKSYYLSTFMK